MYIPTYYYGDIPIQGWEFLVLAFMLAFVWIISSWIRTRKISLEPEYQYFTWGLWAKMTGGIMFGIIYIFYYQGGDTIGYYASALAYCKLLLANPSAFLTAYFGPVSQETLSVFTSETGEPLGYMYFNDQTRIVTKILVPFMIVGGQSYFITTAIISIFTYTGIWKLYTTFTSHFPQHRRHLAIAILFMPSVIFWGSGILKDSFTLAGACFFLYATDRIIRRRGWLLVSITVLLMATWIIVAIKPYIFIILLPGALVWYFYAAIRRIRNDLIRFLIVPLVYISIIVGSYTVLQLFGSAFGKFSLDKALETAVVTQKDLKQDYYDGNSFDIGDFEPTLPGIAGKFPAATTAGLYRPFIWESRNVLMLVSGLENTFILGMTLWIIFRYGPRKIYQLIRSYPIITCSLFFSVLFAFMIGLTTSNFGALVRFKIPLVPLYMASVMVISGILGSSVSQPVESKR